jgi:hypothetical protein
MKTRHRPMFGPGEIIILIAIGILALIVVTGNLSAIWEKLYSGTAVAIVVVMLVEYLLLKGADRSPIYRRELEAARVKRRDDLLALRDLETQLVELRSRMHNVLEREAGCPALREAVEDARQTSETTLARLRERI